MALWHSHEPAAKIAERLGTLSVKQLVGQWQRLKAHGKLPPMPRPVVGPQPRGGGVEHIDGRPRVGSLAEGEDPLLERLNEAHELHDDGSVTPR